MQLAQRCGAKTRRGTECRSPAMPNGRCRMHGGKSPGAPKGNRNNWKHGHHLAEGMAMRKLVRQLLSTARDAVERCQPQPSIASSRVRRGMQKGVRPE